MFWSKGNHRVRFFQALLDQGQSQCCPFWRSLSNLEKQQVAGISWQHACGYLWKIQVCLYCIYIYIIWYYIIYILCYYYYYYHYYYSYIIIYFYILILSYYCITIFLYYHILYYCITILLYYHILSYYYTQTPRFSQAQNSANTREFCTTSNNGKDFMFNYVARVLACVAYTYHITRTWGFLTGFLIQ